jgi:hypothetical protein
VEFSSHVCPSALSELCEGEGGHMHMKKGRVLKWRSVNRGERMWASMCVDDLETGGGTCEKPGYIYMKRISVSGGK